MKPFVEASHSLKRLTIPIFEHELNSAATLLSGLRCPTLECVTLDVSSYYSVSDQYQWGVKAPSELDAALCALRFPVKLEISLIGYRNQMFDLDCLPAIWTWENGLPSLHARGLVVFDFTTSKVGQLPTFISE